MTGPPSSVVRRPLRPAEAHPFDVYPVEYHDRVMARAVNWKILSPVTHPPGNLDGTVRKGGTHRPESKGTQMTDAHRLHRSTTDKKVAGVCSGIAEHFGTDATLVRAVFVASALFGGLGLGLYLVLWVAVPAAPANGSAVPATPTTALPVR
jgi:phage shock protein C